MPWGPALRCRIVRIQHPRLVASRPLDPSSRSAPNCSWLSLSRLDLVLETHTPSFTTTGSASPSTAISSLWPRGTGRSGPSPVPPTGRGPTGHAGTPAVPCPSPCRTCGRRGGRRRLQRLDAQRGQPLLLLGQEPGPGGRLPLLLEPLADVIAVHQHARLDLRQAAVGFDQVRQDPVVPVPVAPACAMNARSCDARPRRRAHHTPEENP